jgi:hypothetical protein
MKLIEGAHLNSDELNLVGLAAQAMACADDIMLTQSKLDGWRCLLYVKKKHKKLFSPSIHNRITKRLRDIFNEVVVLEYKFI